VKQSNSLRYIVEQADQLYALRSDLRNVEASVDLLQSVETSFEVAWRLARARFFLGQECTRGASSISHHRAGIGAGRSAVRQRIERVEGFFWLGVNLALAAQQELPLKAVVHAVQAKRALDKAIQIDAAYHAAGPLRVMGRLQHKLPRIFGGGLQRALGNYEKAIALAPANTVTRIFLAELLLEMGDANRTRIELAAVLEAPTDSEWMFEIERDKNLARRTIETFVSGSND